MRALAVLTREQRLAAVPAVGLVLCLLLPWFRESTPSGGALISSARSGLGAFSWIEAALVVVSGSVLALLWLRAQRRGFHLPGGDGWAITIAGGWALALLVWRMFDRPSAPDGSMGVEWGIVVAMVMAGLLLATGQRLRAADVAEPPNPAATGEHPVARRPDAQPVADMPSRRAARLDLGLDGDAMAPPDDDAPTRRLAPDGELPPDDAAPTRRLPPEQERAADDDAPTRALPPEDDGAADDDAPTRALPPEEPPPTRRLPPDIPPPPPPSPPPPRD